MKRSISRKVMALSTAALTSAVLGGTSLLAGASPLAEAAPSAVTVTYPAGSLESLDPTQWSGGEVVLDEGTVLEGLFGFNSKNQLEPKIASSWKVSDNGRVWTIWLRKTARWSNGQPVTAEDFYYAWMRLLSPSDSNGAVWLGVGADVVNGDAYNAGSAPASAVGIAVVNPYELRLTLSSATNIEGTLADSASMPLYPPTVTAHPNDWWQPQYFVGDGPYVVHSFVPNGKVVLTKNPKYVGHPGEENVGNIGQITLEPAPTVPVEDYQSGALDSVLLTVPSDYSYALKHFKGQVHKTDDADINYLQWDHSDEASPLNSQLVREAIAMAIDRAPIANPVLNNMVEPTTVFAYPGFPTYKYEHNPYPYNVKRARQLLAKAGYPNGKGMPPFYICSEKCPQKTGDGRPHSGPGLLGGSGAGTLGLVRPQKTRASLAGERSQGFDTGAPKPC